MQHGEVITCNMFGERSVDAVISLNDGDVYLCQNVLKGADVPQKFGYKYSYYVGRIEDESEIMRVLEIKPKGMICAGDYTQISTLKNKTVTNKIMTTIKSTLKALKRTEPEKTLLKAGFINEDHDLTSDGQDVLMGLLYEQHKEELKTLATAVIAAREDK